VKRVTPGLVLIALAALATLPLRAQDEQSLTDELLSVYRNRSKKEVETLAKKLDAETRHAERRRADRNRRGRPGMAVRAGIDRRFSGAGRIAEKIHALGRERAPARLV
jgi:hypothetical protein